MDPREFGRYARQRHAETDQAGAVEKLARLQARRSATVVVGDDGTVDLHAHLAGLDAEEVVHTIHAFRRPDVAGQQRSPQQATADALVDICRAARTADLSQIGRRSIPNVTIRMDATCLYDPNDPDCPVDADGRLRGVGQTGWTGPLPATALRRVLGDCLITAVLTDVEGTAVAVTQQVRTVPVGLHRLLTDRDRGCLIDGCDRPPGWCQVAHLGTWYAAGGKLSPATAGLLCRPHHRMFDNDPNLVAILINNRPRICTRTQAIATLNTGNATPIPGADPRTPQQPPTKPPSRPPAGVPPDPKPTGGPATNTPSADPPRPPPPAPNEPSPDIPEPPGPLPPTLTRSNHGPPDSSTTGQQTSDPWAATASDTDDQQYRQPIQPSLLPDQAHEGPGHWSTSPVSVYWLVTDQPDHKQVTLCS